MSNKPMLWIVLNKDGNPWGPFETAFKATAFGDEKWGPKTNERKAKFTIVALRSPEE